MVPLLSSPNGTKLPEVLSYTVTLWLALYLWSVLEYDLFKLLISDLFPSTVSDFFTYP